MAHLRAGVDNVVAGATYQHVDPEVCGSFLNFIDINTVLTFCILFRDPATPRSPSERTRSSLLRTSPARIWPQWRRRPHYAGPRLAPTAWRTMAG